MELCRELTTVCEVPVSRLRDVVREMHEQMEIGLASDDPAQQLKMLPTFVTRLPSGDEQGSWYALDLGGTNFRVLKVTLQSGLKDVQARVCLRPALPKINSAPSRRRWLSRPSCCTAL